MDEAEVCLSGATDGEIIKGSNEEEVSGSNETAGMITEEGNDVKSHTTTHGDSLYELEPADENCAFRMGVEVSVDPAVIHSLSSAFASQVLPSLEKAKSSISEIVSNQQVIIDTLEQENSKFKECTAFNELTITMLKARDYYNKLVTVKKDMSSLHDRAIKLKRRALKLQQQKQKEELQRAHQLEKELERDQMLTAKVASPEF
ncbi:biogenesis of lysosome-related organelles complex 1 subunit 6-like isoform X2 [Pomacea canaliculata]|uniref:biogenesis of lysosome-related organelles complex 1 subunit 6-like isoform X2 n=1 Tax=Pomacea canaliculata TaxID=400727 RepID=UPI000D73CD94|nr:biogenesis of lysosome-related organelles complex 1 subunit 6-like isoform X2 [Pomacea canaliculata]